MMISSLEIENFRCFARFEARDLARVNLLVGMNNSGKTSLLEAVELMTAQCGPQTPYILADILERRGEYLRSTTPPLITYEFAVRHLLRGHALEPDSCFTIMAEHDRTRRMLRATVETARSSGDRSAEPPLVRDEMLPEEVAMEAPLTLRLSCVLDGGKKGSESRFPLTSDGGLRAPENGFRWAPRNFRRPVAPPVRFVPTHSVAPDEVAFLFGEYVLTDEEQSIIHALQIIEPTIERLALAVGDVRQGPERAGLFVKHAGQAQRIPIGSMGDGIWRMLALTLALVGTHGGVLLVDEIDTGLHFSVMAKMWRLIIETAQRLDVQVFATTHSRDCYESLAAVLRDMTPSPGTAAIHRIERDKGRTVVFDEQEIIIAAERGIEVR